MFMSVSRETRIEVTFVRQDGSGLPAALFFAAGGGTAVVAVRAVRGEPGGFLGGVGPGDFLFLGRGDGGWKLRRGGDGSFCITDGGGDEGVVARVAVAGVMKRVGG